MKKSKARNRISPQQQLARNTARYVVDYIDHAPVWQGPIFARGVFRPTQNGAPDKPLEIRWTSNFGETAAQFILRSPRALNVTDEAVYFHICQLVAAGRGVELESEDPEYAACHDAIAAKGFGVGERMNAVSVTSSDLAEIGRAHV